MTTIVGGRRVTTNTLSFDDTKAQLDPNAVKIFVQEALENLDARQDLDDTTVYRPENVLSTIALVDVSTPDGWHLFLDDGNADDKKLLEVESGSVVDSYTPKEGDRIIIAGVEKEFLNNKWRDRATGSIYFVNPVISVLSSTVDLPNSGSEEGDRYLIDDAPPTIQEYDGSAFVSSELPVNAFIKATDSDRFYTRKGNGLIYYLPHQVPLYLELGLEHDHLIENQVDPLPFNRVIFPPLDGATLNLQESWIEATKTQAVPVALQLEFKERINTPIPKKSIYWQESFDAGATWQDTKPFLITSEDGLISKAFPQTFTAGRFYRLAVELSLAPTAEDIILEEAVLNIGLKDINAEQAIADFDGAIVPIVSLPEFTVTGVELFTVEYNVTLLSDLSQLIVSLEDDRGNVLETKPTQNNLTPSTITFTFENVAAFYGDNVAKKYSLDVAYA